MGRDARRTLLVVGDEADLFAALRPLLDSEMLQLRWSRPEDSQDALRECAPWPWGIAGAGAGLPGDALGRLIGKPILWFWLGHCPTAAPAHARVHQQWREMVEDVRGCVSRSVDGITLAPNRGLLAPDGKLVLSAELEGLVSSSPMAIRMSSKSVRPAERAIARHQLSVRLFCERGQTRLEARG